ncbi:MAG: hypothetical protein RIC55_30730 [Pirellulaceae bacterium]
MAEMTIQLRIDPQTGKKDIIVSLRSDEDALPHEHEQLHRRLVEKLIEGGVLSDGEAGKLIIERETAAPPHAETPPTEEPRSAEESA